MLLKFYKKKLINKLKRIIKFLNKEFFKLKSINTRIYKDASKNNLTIDLDHVTYFLNDNIDWPGHCWTLNKIKMLSHKDLKKIAKKNSLTVEYKDKNIAIRLFKFIHFLYSIENYLENSKIHIPSY